jgi:AraC-like DNA-binding protein
MTQTLRSVDAGRLERSCKRPADRILFGPPVEGVERADVRLFGWGFEPHRHDTYTIGMTTVGVQTFRYRGAREISLPGQLVILHPDETHDGVAGTESGFGYRAVYVAPELVRDAIGGRALDAIGGRALDAIGGRALPFVAEPVQRVRPVTQSMASVLADIQGAIDELRCAVIVAALVDALQSLSGQPERPSPGIDMRAVTLVRDHIEAHARERILAATLEAIAGIDRFTIARHFRRAFGTSPDRYRTLRRLELARVAIERGESLAFASAESGFADQSHMTRQFKDTYGFTPARWVTLTAVNGPGASRLLAGPTPPSADTTERHRIRHDGELAGSAADPLTGVASNYPSD